MPTFEEKLKHWATPPGKTEKEKCERAVKMIRNAIVNNSKLSSMGIEIFPKGSFHKRTNTPSESDVDVGILNRAIFFNDYPTGMSNLDFGFVSAK